MNFIELQDDLQNLINDKVSRAKIGEVIGTSRQNINVKFNNPRTEVAVSELQKIEAFYGINIYKSGLCTLVRQYDDSIPQKLSNCGNRISDIQEKNNLSSFQMAGLLGISESEYAKIISDKILPDLKVLNNLKQNFKVSIDWVLYGE